MVDRTAISSRFVPVGMASELINQYQTVNRGYLASDMARNNALNNELITEMHDAIFVLVRFSLCSHYSFLTQGMHLNQVWDVFVIYNRRESSWKACTNLH